MKALCAGLLLGLTALTAHAAEIGEAVTPFTLLDQFDKPYTFQDSTRLVLVARSMASAKLMNAAMTDRPQGFLESHHAVYVADIARMPSFARVFAVPQMRSANYRILLDTEARVASRYDGDRESVQWLLIKDGQLAEQQRFTDPQALRQALDQL